LIRQTIIPLFAALTVGTESKIGKSEKWKKKQNLDAVHVMPPCLARR
jgi:hypothetical protein